jgi:hypothetical protein
MHEFWATEVLRIWATALVALWGSRLLRAVVYEPATRLGAWTASLALVVLAARWMGVF